MSALMFRACTADDAGAVERLRVSGWKTAYRGLVPASFLDAMAVHVERRRKLLAERAGDVAESVAVSGTDIVGWVAAGPCRDSDRPRSWHGEIYACYVLPEWWGRGVGKRLLARATAALAEAGRPDISLWVLEGNTRARRFYESCGFRPDGERQLLDLGGPVPEVRYRRRVQPSIPIQAPEKSSLPPS